MFPAMEHVIKQTANVALVPILDACISKKDKIDEFCLLFRSFLYYDTKKYFNKLSAYNWIF